MMRTSYFSLEKLEANWNFLEKPIRQSTIKRKENLNFLNEKENKKIVDLEENLEQIEKLFETFIKLNSKIYTDQSDEEEKTDQSDEEEKFEKFSWGKKSVPAARETLDLQKNIQENIKKFSKTYPFLNKFDINHYNIKNENEEQKSRAYFIIYKELMLNYLFNEIIYFNEIKKTFDENKKNIVSKLFQKNKENILEEDYTIVDNGIKYISELAETHNRGKKAVFIKIRNKNENELELVCKPRNAKRDELIINLFAEINKLNQMQLKTYNIFNTENMSFWQKLEGKDLAELGCYDGCPPQRFICDTIQNPPKREEMLKKIQKMAFICARLDVSDLHGGNVMLVEGGLEVTKKEDERYLPTITFKILDLEKVDIALIDLEVKHINYPTLLLSIPSNEANSNEIISMKEQELKFIPLNEELVLIEECNKKLKEECSSRVLLASTGELRMATSVYNKKELEIVQILIKNGIKNQDYNIDNNIELDNLIMSDTLNGDIPYFTEKGNSLFYGQDKAENFLAKKN